MNWHIIVIPLIKYRYKVRYRVYRFGIDAEYKPRRILGNGQPGCRSSGCDSSRKQDALSRGRGFAGEAEPDDVI